MVYKHAISTVVPSRNVRVTGPDGVQHGGDAPPMPSGASPVEAADETGV
jgi:hypothetical protein